MKILLFGKNGQVGWELQRSLAPLGEVVALGRESADFCGDLTRPDELADTVRSIGPDVIVNAAAYTAVDRAETEPELAHAVNAVAAGVLAREAAALGAWIVHYSSDYVFDGSGSRPWLETDAPAPLNVYGVSKLEGERLVAAVNPRHLIFRTSWVYAARGGNFARTMLRLAAERDRLTVVDDQFGAPTGADLLADVTAHAIGAACQRSAMSAGAYHLAAAGRTSWHGYARFVIDCASRLRGPLRCQQVDPVPSSAYPTPAHRPLNSCLDTTRLRTALGLHLPPWQDGVERMLRETL